MVEPVKIPGLINALGFGLPQLGANTKAQRLNQQMQMQYDSALQAAQAMQEINQSMMPQRVQAAAQMAQNMGGAQPANAAQKIGQGYNLQQMLQDPNVSIENAAMSLGNRPGANPLMDAANARALAKEQREYNRAELEYQRVEMMRNKPLIGQARAMARTQELINLRAAVGSEKWPTEEKGRYNAIRKLKINDIRQTFEAGALQQAEIEFFNDLIPEGDEWFNLGEDEKRARLEELEYHERQNLEDALLLDGRGLTLDDLAGYSTGRSYQEMMAPLENMDGRGLIETPTTQGGPGGIPYRNDNIPIAPGFMGLPLNYGK